MILTTLLVSLLASPTVASNPDSRSQQKEIRIQAGQEGGAAARTAAVLESEEVIENLRTQLSVLSTSAMNMRVPSGDSMEVFAPRVRVRGLGSVPGKAQADSLNLDLSTRDWPAADEARDVRAEDLALLEPFFATVEFFHYAKFYTREGSFLGPDRDSYHSVSGFKGLAQFPDGTIGYATADLGFTWAGEADALGVGWRIQSIELQSFKLMESARPFFTDVLDTALDPEALADARYSVRDENLIAFVNSVGRGEQSLDEIIPGWAEGIVAHEEPFVMSHVSVVDLDRDGFDDFYVCPSDATAQFFRNRGDGTFEEIAGSLGLALDKVEAATFADFDNDGDADLFLSYAPWTTHFFRNEDGRFVDRSALTEGGFPQLAFAISPMDYDGDGLLDVYFSRYNGFWIGANASRMEAAQAAGESYEIAFPGMDDEEAKVFHDLLFAPGVDPFVSRPGPPNRLFRNLGDGRFEHAQGAEAAEQFTQSLAATWSDFDLDGDMDLYVVTEAAPNQLVRNNGDGTFTDITEASTSDVGFGMGLGIGDYNNDGRQDVYVTNMYSKAGLRISAQIGANELIRGAARGNSLLRNGPEGWSRVSGVEEPSILVEAADFGWGGAFADFNNDGVLDLYAPAGFVTMPEAVEGVGET
jgi:VCBS repeat protein